MRKTEIKSKANEPAATRLLRLDAVKQRVLLSTSCIYRLMSANEFPKRIPLAKNAVAWDEREIEDWIAQRKRARIDERAAA
jgi:prophage regulatory protein